MSARGVKGASVAQGGVNGMDFADRQVLAPRYEAMAAYRAQLVQLFTFLPYFYAVAVILTVVHVQAPSLKPISARFLPPFWVQVAGLVATAAVTLRSIRVQNSVAWMALSGLCSTFVLYLVALYSWAAFMPVEAKYRADQELGFAWYLLGAIVNAFIVTLNALAIYDGVMINALAARKRK